MGLLKSERLLEDPLPADVVKGLFSDLKEISAEHAIDSEVNAREDPPQPQSIEVELVGALLRGLGDPDWEVYADFSVGVPIGLDVELPRVPAVYPAKTHWALPEQQALSEGRGPRGDFFGTEVPNYASARLLESDLLAALEEQEGKGYMLKLPAAVAQQRYGSRLSVAALGAIVKAERDDGSKELRVIHDGSNGVHVNHRICVRDGSVLPTVDDLRVALSTQASTGQPHFGITVDVKEAHRQVAIRRQDWGLLACRSGPQHPSIFINTRGTYGICSAAYWWGRLAAGIHRLVLFILGAGLPLWMVLYADDWDLVAFGTQFDSSLIAAVLLLRALGVPLSWPKVRGGFTYTWLGLELNRADWSLGLSERRAQWLLGWLAAVLDAGSVDVEDLRGALGRMSWAYSALSYDKPFLGGLFRLLAVVENERIVEVPVYAKLIMMWLYDRLLHRRSMPVRPRAGPKGPFLRVDAKAEGMSVAVGGWRPVLDENGSISTALSPWFHIVLDPVSAPWAFAKGLPATAISALELLATTVGVILLAPRASPGEGVLHLSGLTDSQVSSHVVRKGSTTSFPLCVVAMELAAQLEARSATMELLWIPRDQNSEADRLADSDFSGFSPSRRVGPKLEDVPFMVLDDLVKAGLAWHEEAAAKVRAGPRLAGGGQPVRQAAGRGGQKRPKLREREPW